MLEPLQATERWHRAHGWRWLHLITCSLLSIVPFSIGRALVAAAEVHRKFNRRQRSTLRCGKSHVHAVHCPFAIVNHSRRSICWVAPSNAKKTRKISAYRDCGCFLQDFNKRMKNSSLSITGTCFCGAAEVSNSHSSSSMRAFLKARMGIDLKSCAIPLPPRGKTIGKLDNGVGRNVVVTVIHVALTGGKMVN